MIDDKYSPQAEPPTRKRGFFVGLRTNFLTGIVVIAPIALTIWLIWTVINLIDSWVLPFIPAAYRPVQYLPIDIPGVGVVVFLVFTVLVGWLAKGIIGRTFLTWGESLVDRMPIIRSVYNGVKQIAETVFSQTEATFDRACLIEYPRKGVWAIAFVSATARGPIKSGLASHGEIISVFMPTTPNPTSGFLLYLPASDIILLDMTVEDAAKLIISAGLVYPAEKPAAPPSVLPFRAPPG